jgi:hypothetical protein
MQRKQFLELQGDISKIVHEIKVCPTAEERMALLRELSELIAEADAALVESQPIESHRGHAANDVGQRRRRAGAV